MKKTQLMGILNVTPNSCYDQGRYFDQQKAIDRGIEIFQQGADIIDIGGESTMPGASPVDVETELSRVMPVIHELRKSVTIPLSIDTRHWQVAEAAVSAGVEMINDITGFTDPNMVRVARNSSAMVCAMHMQGTPQTMQLDPRYPRGVVIEIVEWFERQANILLDAGLPQEKIFLDPGIGFGKSIDHNLEILHNLARFKMLGFPLLLGLSRKSFMGRINNKSYGELLPETLAANTIACLAKVDMLRVHDIAENRSIIDLLSAYQRHQHGVCQT